MPHTKILRGKESEEVTKMETEELFFDEDMEQIEVMRSERKKMKDKDFAKLINKKELSDFEMDEMFS